MITYYEHFRGLSQWMKQCVFEQANNIITETKQSSLGEITVLSYQKIKTPLKFITVNPGSLQLMTSAICSYIQAVGAMNHGGT